MKEASGDLNMTVVTIVAVAAVGALFYLFVWPIIQKSIVTQTCKTYGSNWKAEKVKEESTGTGNAKVMKWKCCEYNESGAATGTCVDTDYGENATD